MIMPKKRAYNSELRQAQARVTKDRILATARILFESNGFEKVTIEEIAKKSEVSAPTIYSLFQSKIGILRILLDEALSPEQFESLVQKAREEKSPSKHLQISASIARRIYDAETEQLGNLQNASILDPEFKKLELEREKRRYLRQEESVNMLARENSLAAGLSVAKARDVLWAFTGRDLYRMLVSERGWSSDEYETWLAHLLEQTLLKESRR